MHWNIGAAFAAAAVAALAAHPVAASDAGYPRAPWDDVRETRFGVTVSDPYRSLETLDSERTKSWIDAEKRLTAQYLGAAPARARIREDLRRLGAFRRVTIPIVAGGNYFFRANTGLQEQDVLFTAHSLSDVPSPVLDPNALWPDGKVRVADYSISPGGEYAAYAVSVAGSDVRRWNVRDVAARRDLPDVVDRSMYSTVTWRDERGFYYTGYSQQQQRAPGAAVPNQAIYFHELGTPQSADALIYQRRDHPEWVFDTAVTADGRYLIITATAGTGPERRVFFQELDRPATVVKPLLTRGGASYTFVDGDGPTLWFLTDAGAPRRRLVAVDVRQPDTMREVIAESAEPIRRVTTAGGSFIVDYVQDAHTVLRRFGLNGRRYGDVPLPDVGSVGALAGSRGDSVVSYTFSTFATPQTVLRYDLATGRTAEPFPPPAGRDRARYVTEQVFVPAKDGTRVPMFVSHRRGVRPRPETPALLTGYGGFGVSMTPYFSAASAEWMEIGGLYVTANVRGGGEYGESWHRAATGVRKQTAIDDFVACAEWLIANRYTSSSKLAVAGLSNGALLVGGAVTQRPDLYAAAVPIDGVFDMLRYDKFTVGRAWAAEYGSPDDEEQFRALFAYSPVQNVRRGTRYPATLVMAGENDERVFPAHSFKFVAALQAAQTGSAPILLDVRPNQGHDPAAITSQFMDEVADAYAFLVDVLHISAAQR